MELSNRVWIMRQEMQGETERWRSRLLISTGTVRLIWQWLVVLARGLWESCRVTATAHSNSPQVTTLQACSANPWQSATSTATANLNLRSPTQILEMLPPRV